MLHDVSEKIKLIHCKPDQYRQHVVIKKPELCDTNCKNNECLSICPAQVFVWDGTKPKSISVFYKQCIECGACRLVCPLGNIKFSYPSGGYGVSFTEGTEGYVNK
ncbi:hypothetical protein P22_0302 [Propionispora sp. 2/2-37]|uniref:ferredoxin family protein n=1 Tax=Propionispora sp. 2/2-37 TaxID=1677858 RepID=UPI0006BB6EB8|nr:4Fe-4S dicluster domain-containing protein [Propionispora sp. 2/2-37]CUH94236.1 hypothetical protein P22_0302 [Propionispora sp. 2/2-37]